MNYKSIAQAKAIEKKNKEWWLALNPKLNDESGIYVLTRIDENGIKYAYVGQAKHILTRLAQHLVGYQHIDLSLKKHSLYSNENSYGWDVKYFPFSEAKLDLAEQEFIKKYANAGYQLRNKTSGSQGVGKTQIDEYRPAKGYRDGLKQGKKNLARELTHIIDTHLEISIKKENKISKNALEKFYHLLDENTYL